MSRICSILKYVSTIAMYNLIYNQKLISKISPFNVKPYITNLFSKEVEYVLDEHINRNFDKLNDNDLHIAHFINTHVDECKI